MCTGDVILSRDLVAGFCCLCFCSTAVFNFSTGKHGSVNCFPFLLDRIRGILQIFVPVADVLLHIKFTWESQLWFQGIKRVGEYAASFPRP